MKTPSTKPLVVSQLEDWHDFTTRFMEYCGFFHLNRSYCCLAVAIAKADKHAQVWDYYLNLARLCSNHYHEMQDTRLTRQKETFTAQGWVFTFNGSSWMAETPGLEISGDTLFDTLAGVVRHGLPLLETWAEKRQHITRKANA